MSVEFADFWIMVCTNESCPANGEQYKTDLDTIECGSCNTIYTKVNN